MVTVNVLKRRDASSVVVGVVLALFVSGAVQDWAYRPAAWLSGQTTSGDGWNSGLWRPLVTLLAELLVLELVVRVYVWLAAAPGKK